MKVKSDHHSEFSNLSNWKEEAWKNQGFNGIQTRDLRDTAAMLYQLSYKATQWEQGQFIEFISPVRSEMMWSIYEIIHISTAVVHESEEWSSQWIFQFKQLERRSLNWKIHCDDHSSLSCTTAVLIWIISYVLHINYYCYSFYLIVF